MTDLDRELEIVDDLKAQLDGYDFYAYSDSIDDSSKQLEKEMTVILGIALVIIIAVLLVHVTELYGSADIPL